MMHRFAGGRRPPRWTEWSVGTKILAVAGGLVLVVGIAALVCAATMWLWNWLMPAIFKLPTIGFWEALGLLVLSRLLLGGGRAARMGRGHWRRARLRDAMREGGTEGATEEGAK